MTRTESEQYTETLTVPLKPSELAELERAAELAHMPRTSLARALLFWALGRPDAPIARAPKVACTDKPGGKRSDA